MPARENTYQDDWGAKPPTQMANIGGGGRQGMVMKVLFDEGKYRFRICHGDWNM